MTEQLVSLSPSCFIDVFSSLARSRYLFLFSHSRIFTLRSAGTAKSPLFRRFSLLFSHLLIIIIIIIRVFANGPGDLGSIAGRVIPNTFKMVLDTSLLKTRQYKVGIKGKVEQSTERSCAFPYSSSSYWKGSLLVPLDYGR